MAFYLSKNFTSLYFLHINPLSDQSFTNVSRFFTLLLCSFAARSLSVQGNRLFCICFLNFVDFVQNASTCINVFPLVCVEMGSQCILGCPGTHCVAKAGLERLVCLLLLLSAGIRGRAAMPHFSLLFHSFKNYICIFVFSSFLCRVGEESQA